MAHDAPKDMTSMHRKATKVWLRWRAILFAAIGTTTVTNVLSAQTIPTVVRVRIVDSARIAVPSAEVTLFREKAVVEARAFTNSSGGATLATATSEGQYHVVVRKLGYQRADRFVSTTPGDTVQIDMELHAVPQILEATRVTADADVRRKSYFIDADAIDQSSRSLFDAFDVIRKLRPDMWKSRAPEICDGPRLGKDWPALTNVWVNGHLQRVVKRYVRARPDAAFVREQVTEILKEIKPEHIAEMRFADCFDTTAPGNNANDAVFISLVPGVQYVRGRGSFVAPRSAGLIQAGSPPAYHGRILGTFDEATGEPIDSAVVTDSVSRVSAVTSRTGTIALSFLPTGASILRITKRGFADTLITVMTSARDTISVTVLLRRR